MEEREYKIYGKDVTPEIKEDVKAAIEEWRGEARKPMEGEIEKTPQETAFVKTLNGWLGEEFAELNLPRAEVVPEQIHILTEDGFRRVCDEDIAGFFGKHGVIIVNKDFCLARDHDFLLKVIMHESVHGVSMEKHYVDVAEHDVIFSGLGHRIGSLGKTSEDEHEHFRGLNEAITEAVAYELWHKHSAELKDEFGVDTVKKHFNFSLMRTLDVLLGRMAEKSGKKQEEILRELKKGMLDGTMMHLREVEKAFGPGSLRVLAAFQSCTKTDKENAEHEDFIAGKIARYFLIDDEAERDAIAKEVLVEREYEAYQKAKTMPERMEKFK